MLDPRGQYTPPILILSLAAQRLTIGSLGLQVALIGTFLFLLTPIWWTGHALVARRAAVDGIRGLDMPLRRVICCTKHCLFFTG